MNVAVSCPTCLQINFVSATPGTWQFNCIHCGRFYEVTVPPPPQNNTSEAVGLIGGAVLGAAIAGPVGAIVGGLLGALLGRESKPAG